MKTKYYALTTFFFSVLFLPVCFADKANHNQHFRLNSELLERLNTPEVSPELTGFAPPIGPIQVPQVTQVTLEFEDGIPSLTELSEHLSVNTVDRVIIADTMASKMGELLEKNPRIAEIFLGSSSVGTTIVILIRMGLMKLEDLDDPYSKIQWSAGSRVRIKGLIDRSDLNGKIGILNGRTQNRRVGVNLEGYEDPIAIKKENCEVIGFRANFIFKDEDENILGSAIRYGIYPLVRVGNKFFRWLLKSDQDIVCTVNNGTITSYEPEPSNSGINISNTLLNHPFGLLITSARLRVKPSYLNFVSSRNIIVEGMSDN